MPEMELFPPDRNFAGDMHQLSAAGKAAVIRGVWGRLLAYMIWPDNETARATFISQQHLLIMEALDKHENEPDYTDAHLFAYQQFRALGGARAVLKPFRHSKEQSSPCAPPLRCCILSAGHQAQEA